MTKSKIFRRLALTASLIMLLTSTVQTTYGFIVTKTVSLVNVFEPYESIVNGLLINKTVEHPLGEGYVIPDTVSFDFEVGLGPLYADTTLKTTAGDIKADENGTLTVPVRPGKTFCIEGVDAGTGVTVTELQKDGTGFAVKDEIATKEVTVSKDGSVTVDFVNIYTPAKVRPANVTVSGIKLLEGREWREGDSFSFRLEQDAGNGNWTTLGTRTITFDPANADFNRFDLSQLVRSLTFDKVGTYTFRMTEIVGGLDNVDYDKTVNTFAIRVTDADMDGRLEIGDVTGAQNAAVTRDGGNFDVAVTFNNTFVPPATPDDISVTVTVNKTVENTGKASIGPDGFEFVLENTATGERTALKSDASGRAVFTLPFTAADIGKTHSYKLSETNEGAAGVTYDTDVYDITVTISLSEDNKLAATVTLNGQTVEACVAGFQNTYHRGSEPAPPTGDSSNTALWFTLMLLSAAACTALLILGKKHRMR